VQRALQESCRVGSVWVSIICVAKGNLEIAHEKNWTEAYIYVEETCFTHTEQETNFPLNDIGAKFQGSVGSYGEDIKSRTICN
jgi:hypothetical protein